MAWIMTGGTAHMLRSLMQAAAWMTLLALALTVPSGRTLAPVSMPAPAACARAGGWLFGVGAALNGGCSPSTLHRLADGEVGLLATLSGFALGVLLWANAGSLWPVHWTPLTPAWTRWPLLAPWLLAALVLWALGRVLGRVLGLRELARLAPAMSLRQRLLAPHYPLAVAAALMGLAGGVLYATRGPWSYANHLRSSVEQAWTGGPAPAACHTAPVAALLLGMMASAQQRGALAWRRPQGAASWLRHSGGGAPMGAGAAMVPGGNDTLPLNALPTLALQAVGAYVAMLGGIASVLWLMRRARVPMPRTIRNQAGSTEVRSPTIP